MSAALTQSDYQVRLDWGLAGLRRLAGGGEAAGGGAADLSGAVVVVVDVLSPDAGMTEARSIAQAAAGHGAVVLQGGLRNASAVARECLAEQEARGARTPFILIAAGEGSSDGVRFAVEDLLGAGAVVAALTELGLDHTSPEAAAACEAFHGLRRATSHLLTACGTGRGMAAQGRTQEMVAAAAVDADDLAPRWQGDRFG